MFEARSTETEFLDRPDCDMELAAASYRFMETVNRHFGGVRTVRRYIAGEVAGRRDDPPLRILDIGSGCGDIPLAVSRWARGQGIPLQFTCLEMAGPAVEIARRNLARACDPAVHLLQEDVFAHHPAEPYDCAVASMCCHHFGDSQILTLLQRLRGFVRQSVLINDLRRSRRAYLAAALLATGAPAGVRHDALLSIRRGFKVGELHAMLQQLEDVELSVESTWWFRIAAIIRFKQGAKP